MKAHLKIRVFNNLFTVFATRQFENRREDLDSLRGLLERLASNAHRFDLGLKSIQTIGPRKYIR